MPKITPQTADEIADFIASAIAEKAPLEITAGASKRGLGEKITAEHILDLSAFSGIVSYEPQELVLTVKPATPLAELQQALAEKRQILAFEPSDIGALCPPVDKAQATIGGTVICNLSGSRRPFAGAARDFLLGFSAVSGRGEIFKAGGKVVKNVTGFDLSKLICGSYGTLAAVTEITLKTHPMAENNITWHLSCPDIGTARPLLQAAINGAFPPTAAAYMPPENNGTAGILLRFEGGTAPLKAAETHLKSLAADFTIHAEGAESAKLWRALSSAEIFNYREGEADFLWKISLPPAECVRFIAALSPEDKQGEQYFADWGGGLIWFKTDDPNRGQAIRSAAEQCGGYAHVIRAPDDTVRFHPRPPAELALLRNIKGGFDPHNILNPNRLGF